MAMPQQANACCTCGDIGYEEAMATCSKCRIVCEHIYCMRVYIKVIPEDWICDECQLGERAASSTHGGDDNFHCKISSTSSTRHSIGSRDRSLLKLHKPVEIGKVKFLSTDEAIQLSSKASRESTAKNDLVQRPRNSCGHRLDSYATQRLPIKLVKPSPVLNPSCNASRTGHDRVKNTSKSARLSTKESTERRIHAHSYQKQKVSSSRPAEDGAHQVVLHVDEAGICNVDADKLLSKTSLTCSTSVHELRDICAEETDVMGIVVVDEKCKTVITTKEIDQDSSLPIGSNNLSSCFFSGSNDDVSTHTAPLNSDHAEIDQQDQLQLFFNPYFPSLRSTWKGGLKFMDEDANTPGKFYGGVQAQPPSRVHRRAYEFSRTMPIILQVHTVPRAHIISQLFHTGLPDFRDIGLYFFPSANIQSSQDNYASLLGFLEVEDAAMRSCIDGVELLIFSSNQLNADSRDVVSFGKPFMWGVFRVLKGKFLTRENKKLSPYIDLETCGNAGTDEGKAAKGKIGGGAATAETALRDFSNESHNKTMHLETPNAPMSATTAASSRVGKKMMVMKTGPRLEEKMESVIPLTIAHEQRKTETRHGPATIKMNTQIHWVLPPKRWIKLNIAGYMNQNENVACASGIIRNEFGKWVFGYAVGVGTRSFSAPELLAMSHGLKDAWERGFRQVLVELESRSALELLRTPSIAPISDRSLVDCCLHLINRRWDCRAYLIFREANACANQLAAFFCNRESAMTSFHYPPSGLLPFLQNDLVQNGLSSASPL